MARLIDIYLAEWLAWVAINTKKYCFSTLELKKLVMGKLDVHFLVSLNYPNQLLEYLEH